MEEQKDKSVSPKSKSSYKTPLLIALIIIIALVSGVKIYLDTEEKAVMSEEMEKTLDRLDSISIELNGKIIEIQKLGGDVAELEIIRKNLEKDKQNLQNEAKRRNSELTGYKDKVEGYEELLKLQDAKIKQLEAVNKELLAENTGLKKEKNVLNDSISNLRKKERELQSKVDQAARLKAENISVAALNSRGREREGEFRARQIEQLKIAFNLADNKVAPISGKDIMIRIIAPDKNVLFDVATGSGTFMIAGKELFYTARQEILFDNTRQQLEFFYENNRNYEAGVYEVEIYADDYIIGTQKFTVK